jgi:hypothetical protein
MAILYVFKVNDPNNVGPFPPSVASSTWLTNLIIWFENNQIANSKYSNVVVFADDAELNAFVNTYKCTDAGLLADISAWKSAHNVSYSSQYFTLTDAGVSPTPVVS